MVLLQLVVLLFCLSSQSFYMLYILLFLNQEKTILIFIRRKIGLISLVNVNWNINWHSFNPEVVAAPNRFVKNLCSVAYKGYNLSFAMTRWQGGQAKNL